MTDQHFDSQSEAERLAALRSQYARERETLERDMALRAAQIQRETLPAVSRTETTKSYNYASAAAQADFIVPNMVAEAASGSKTPKEAAERAQKRAERYYKV